MRVTTAISGIKEKVKSCQPILGKLYCQGTFRDIVIFETAIPYVYIYIDIFHLVIKLNLRHVFFFQLDIIIGRKESNIFSKSPDCISFILKKKKL